MLLCLLVHGAAASAASVDLLIMLGQTGSDYTLQQTISPDADGEQKESANIRLDRRISDAELIFIGPQRHHYSSRYLQQSSLATTLTIDSGSLIVRYRHSLQDKLSIQHDDVHEFLISSLVVDVDFSDNASTAYSVTVFLPEGLEFAFSDTGGDGQALTQQRRSISIRGKGKEALRVPVRYRKIDADRDGVVDLLDLCPDSQSAALVDRSGCEPDADTDGVSDIVDICPDSRPGTRVDDKGCETDSDRDGLADRYDQCDNTPEHFPVGANGCSLDSDADGVPDGADKCPESEPDEPVTREGCSLDFDQDGVPNYRDRCRSTAFGRAVDSSGCETDTDADGIPDRLDVCVDSPANIIVDTSGCAVDTDSDKIPDYRDICLLESAAPGDDYGCPNAQQEQKQGHGLVLQGLSFPTGSAFLSAQSRQILDRVARAIIHLQPAVFEIGTHSDNIGDADYNLSLSQQRAETIRQYLMVRGVSANAIVARGYGESVPLLGNSSDENREANRRVELKKISE